MDQNQNQKNSQAKLAELLNFNPVSEAQTKGSLAEALEEIQKERIAILKAKSKAQLVKAVELSQKMKKLDSEFKKEFSKLDKELNGILRGIEAVMAGKEPEEAEPEKAPAQTTQATEVTQAAQA